MKNDIYKPVLFQTTMRNHNRAEGGVVGMGQKDLRLNRTACLMQRLMLAAFFALAVSALAVGISQGERYLQAFTLALLGLSLYTALCVPAAKRLEHLGPLRLWLLLTILCTAIKVFWIWRVRVPLAGDYSVFWGYANALSERTTVYGGRYMALFPHIFGYADFLSWFIRLSGPQPMLAPVLNVLLTVCSGSFLYHLCLRWFHLPAATLAYLLWILCPSQTIYNSLVLSEPLYTALILGVLSLLTETERFAALKGYPLWMGVLSGTAGGVLLRWVNGVRPIAAILLIALLLWLSLLNLNRLAARNWRRWWGLCMARCAGGLCPSGAGLECPAFGTDRGGAVPHAGVQPIGWLQSRLRRTLESGGQRPPVWIQRPAWGNSSMDTGTAFGRCRGPDFIWRN